jgi:sugar phosphate isomerase/epimerase
MALSRTRRGFLRSSGAAAGSAFASSAAWGFDANGIKRNPGVHLKLGLNAYSFNGPLTSSKMTLDDVIDYCAAHNIDGLDPTGYYFPGYPKVPPDDYLYGLKRKAYLNGVTLSGTGVRNNFTLAGADELRGEVQLVKDWVVAGEKMGAGFVRVFSGPAPAAGRSRADTLRTMIPAFQECADYGKKHGVLVALQHHDDFLKTAAETIEVVKAVDSDWFSVVLDVGSLRQGDPYEEVQQLLPYACTWQIKELVYFRGKETPIDLPRIRAIIEKTGYRGFLPFEALGRGNPDEVTAFLDKVRRSMF